ncbi:hypothetical protein [Pseudomonas cichorii]|nr:hypothetical protein [Pseudomonas cichorii]QVE17973.1 hypothetical protein KGD89_04225 [Pseudomonas cichorii]GFM68687.1 hypothetical protein PSCICJ_48050 [Pseudomonas cichorii]SDP00614.1 hypothetical protein SAMN05216599_116139 [Pseudomonas cichorii]
MLTGFMKNRTVRAIGSAMDVYPVGDYSEHSKPSSPSMAIATYWKETGKYLGKAIEQHDETSKHSGHAADCRAS